MAEIPERQIRRALDLLEAARVPPGHWGSPYPSAEDVSRAADAWDAPPPELPAVDLRVEKQLDLVRQLARFRGQMNLPEAPSPARRYYRDNQFFSHGDAYALYAMMRHLAPGHVVEVGSGYSSALMLDVSEQFFDNGIEFVFIEPRPARLEELLRPGDLQRSEVIAAPAQEAPLAIFDRLGEGDILFIDSSHVAKMGSDVNLLLFEVLPRLAPGVHVHIHDIFYPFDYPRDWVETRRFPSNEAYLVRAFLQYNDRFRIRLFCDYLRRFHREWLQSVYPELADAAPGSLWLSSSR
jgi:predicted O-methyltransferase YrrM